MTFAIGIFDLFTYTIPGSLSLGFLSYLAVRLHWIDPHVVGQTPVVLLVIVLILASYLLGYAVYPLGAAANRLVPRRRTRRPREEFVRRNPAARDRDFVRADSFLLLSALQMHEKDMASEVVRLRAAGLMLRNSAGALVPAFLAAIVELVLGPKPALAAGCAVLFAAGFVALIVQGRRLGHWANLKTLELAHWLPDIDEKLRPDQNS
ncbi:hypothetical protein [Amycolatopsis cihanbeyliensis]|uniref:Uncharacterized protein n=1 Tax=Amycolatopsis cihanbeyliensis TaxID=1128664 RepID=A0A542DFM4_AMYCI|nr:hypothetical protein [Amycolatopsis cihanbeyliensis]TQJ01898.1 hypothetical protein FB471_1614 [Amycolatopsis cihanbeyliensis]